MPIPAKTADLWSAFAFAFVGASLVCFEACVEDVAKPAQPSAEAGTATTVPSAGRSRMEVADSGTGAAVSSMNAAGAGAGAAGHGIAAADSGAGASGSSATAGAAGNALANTAGTTSSGTAGMPASAGAPAIANADDSKCLDGITGYAKDGPFEFETSQSGSVKLWVPSVPTGCKVPIVHFANGTGAACENYRVILERLATHGFLTTCFENTATAEGTQCVTAIETALMEHPDLAAMKVGSAGHEQGGGAALLCVYRAEQQWGAAMTYAGLGVIPVSGLGGKTPDYAMLYTQIKAPIFMFTASDDMLVPDDWVRTAYDNLTSERYWYEATGATHIPLPLRWAQESSVAWFRWKLLGDQAAGEYFKKMPDSNDWDRIESSPGM
jgi:hypothetical protein